MSDEKKNAEDSAEQVFLPETTNIKFLGHIIRMRPVPIIVAKELRRLPERLSKIMNEAAKDPSPESMSQTDIAATDLYLDTVYILLKYYKVEVSRDELEEKATLPELKAFVDQQVKVQGDEDFLFSPLRRTTEIFFPNLKVMKSQPLDS